MEFAEDGTLQLGVSRDDADYLFDEIGSEWKIRQIQREKAELLHRLELYYQVFFLHRDPREIAAKLERENDEEFGEADAPESPEGPAGSGG